MFVSWRCGCICVGWVARNEERPPTADKPARARALADADKDEDADADGRRSEAPSM